MMNLLILSWCVATCKWVYYINMIQFSCGVENQIGSSS